MVNETTAPTIDELGLAGDIQTTLADIAAKYRDTTIPEGEVLAESELPEGDGSTVRWTKQRSGVMWNGQRMPEWITVFDFDRGTSRIAITKMGPKLAQRGRNGHPNFFQSAEARADYYRDVLGKEYVEPVPIAESCEVCNRSRPPNSPKPFYDILDLDEHMETMHPRTFASNLRREDRARQAQQNELILAAIGRDSMPIPQIEAVDTAASDGTLTVEMEPQEPAIEVQDTEAVTVLDLSRLACDIPGCDAGEDGGPWVVPPGKKRPDTSLAAHKRFGHKED